MVVKIRSIEVPMVRPCVTHAYMHRRTDQASERADVSIVSRLETPVLLVARSETRTTSNRYWKVGRGEDMDEARGSLARHCGMHVAWD
jgi:hypothetical protein